MQREGYVPGAGLTNVGQLARSVVVQVKAIGKPSGQAFLSCKKTRELGS